MSYEGYTQNICANGHFTAQDTYDNNETCHCGAAYVWSNAVDETNCDQIGDINMDQFIQVPAKTCTCHCGHVHTVSSTLYRVPTAEETEAARQFWDGEKYLPLSTYEEYAKQKWGS